MTLAVDRPVPHVDGGRRRRAVLRAIRRAPAAQPRSVTRVFAGLVDGHPRTRPRRSLLFRATETVVVAITSDSSVYTPATAARLFRLTNAVAGLDGIRPASVRSLATIRVADVGQTLSTRPLLPAAAAGDPRLCARAQHDVTRLGLADGILASQDGRGWTIVASTGAARGRRATAGAVAAGRSGRVDRRRSGLAWRHRPCADSVGRGRGGRSLARTSGGSLAPDPHSGRAPRDSPRSDCDWGGWRQPA